MTRDIMPEAEMKTAPMPDGQGQILVLSGAYRHETLGTVSHRIYNPASLDIKTVRSIDLAAITDMDTSGAWLVKRLVLLASEAGAKVSIDNASERHAALLGALPDSLRTVEKKS
ncbi:MAG: hypothetical protein RIR97_1281, partial [Pseudomonadota bacterium]